MTYVTFRPSDMERAMAREEERLRELVAQVIRERDQAVRERDEWKAEADKLHAQIEDMSVMWHEREARLRELEAPF